MDRTAARPILIALLCIVAIALAAATLNTAVPVESGGAGPGSDARDLPAGDTDRDGVEPPPRGEPVLSSPLPDVCIPYLLDPLVILGLVVLFAGVAYGAIRRFDALAGVGLVVAYLPITLVLMFFALNCEFGTARDQTVSGMAVDPPNRTEMADPVRDAGQTAAPEITFVLFLVLGIALVGVLAVLVTTRSGTPDADDEDEPDEETDVAAVGRVAGEAADRIEDEDGDAANEVYRAWREMTTYLDVDRPESTTPGEFADAAVDAGMAREDVTELTDLFREVRYGHREATEQREARAVRALRRIETEYATEERP